MTELNRQNAEQLRRVAEENTKSKQKNIRNINKSNSHKFNEQYLDADTALKEFEDLCENYQLYRIKDQILDLQKTTISRDHDAFTIRSTAKLVDMIAEEIFTKHDIK